MTDKIKRLSAAMESMDKHYGEVMKKQESEKRTKSASAKKSSKKK